MGTKPDESREISVLVKPGSREATVVPLPDGDYVVTVKARPVAGRANAELVELLAAHFGVPKGEIYILTGLKSRRKRIRITSI